MTLLERCCYAVMLLFYHWKISGGFFFISSSFSIKACLFEITRLIAAIASFKSSAPTNSTNPTNPIRPGVLTWLSLEGTAALEAVAAPLFGSRRLAKAALNNFAIARLLNVMPALREYALLAAALELADMQQTVVVDMPATGHGVAWLSVAGRLANLVPAGRTRDQALRVDAAMRDPKRSTIVAVTLTEALVLAETHQLRTTLKADLGRDIDHLVVNRAPSIPEQAMQQARDLAAHEPHLAEPAQQLAAWLEQRAAARERASEFARNVNATWIDEYPNQPLPLTIAAALRTCA